MGNFRLVKRLMGLVKPLKSKIILAVILGVAGHLTAIAIPLLGGYGILTAAGYYDGFLIVVFIGLAICAVSRGLLKYGEQMLNHFVAFKMLALLRSKIFTALRNLAPAKVECRDKGNFISIVTSDIEMLEVFFAHTISPVMIAFTVSLIMCFYIGVISIILLIPAVIAYISMGILLPVLTSRENKNTGRDVRDQLGTLDSWFLDCIDGIEESISYNDGDRKLNELRTRVKILLGKQEKLKKSEGVKSALTGTAVLFFSFSMLITSSLLFTKGVIEFDGVILSTIAMMSSFGPVIALSELSNNLIQVFAAGERVFDMIDEEPVVAENDIGIEIKESDFEFKNVSFAYDNEKILNNVNFKADGNNIVGISGKSGSGKSTMLKLLMRFWDTDKGEVQVGGFNVRKIRTVSIRDIQSYMTQETVLFNDTILENVKMAKIDASREDVISACRKASIHSFIMNLPDGYDTHVGELGNRLSGGEKQRIGLARVFLHNSDMILLDEPTSNLDSLNEGRILKALYESREKKNIILISHRESTLGISDVRYRMKNGIITLNEGRFASKVTR